MDFIFGNMDFTNESNQQYFQIIIEIASHLNKKNDIFTISNETNPIFLDFFQKRFFHQKFVFKTIFSVNGMLALMGTWKLGRTCTHIQ